MKNNGIKNPHKEKKSILYWIFMSFVFFFLFKMPFDTALFNGYTIQYEGPIYTLQLLSAIALILMCIYSFYHWQPGGIREFISVLVWIIPLTYLISMINAASPHYAKNMLYFHVIFATFFISAVYLSKSALGARIIQLVITISGYIVTLYGFFNMFGNMYSQDAVMLDQGFRLTSVFQYANAYAAYLMAIMLCCLHYISASRKWYYAALHGLMLVPIVISFWLTLSRGALVVLPVIFLFVLPFMRISRQIMWMLYFLISLPLSFLVMDKLTQLSLDIFKQVTGTIATTGKPSLIGLSDPRSATGWGLLIAVSAAAAFILTGLKVWLEPRLDKWLAKFSEKKISPFVFPIAGILAGSLIVILLFGNTGIVKLFPETLQKRIESINFEQHSVLERETFYRDSLKLIKDYPVFGAGGGGWAALYEKYQNNPYVSRQAHNFFLQYLVEVGIVGFVVLMAFLFLVFFFFVKKHFSLGKDEQNHHLIFYFVTISLLIHSAIDFEMSYVFLAALVFLCLGGMASIADQPAGWLKKIGERRYVKYTYLGAISIIAIVFLVMSLVMFSANRLYASAMPKGQEEKSLEDVLGQVDKALKLQPNHPYYLLARADLLSQGYSQSKNEQFYQDWKNTIAYAKQKEPHNRQIVDAEFKLLMVKGQYEEAAKQLKEALVNYPWDITLYEQAIGVNVESWNRARQNKTSSAADQYEKAVKELYNTVIAKTKDLEKLPKGQMQGRPFNVTPSISFNLGQMEYVKGNTKEAIEFFRPAAASAQIDQPLQPQELERQKQYVRWYLAALKKVNQNDQPLYDKFVAKFPSEKQEIDKLASATF